MTRRTAIRRTGIALFACWSVWMAPASGQTRTSILSTKHNLSAGGMGAIHATVEDQVCVFCHTPHSKVSVQPLWNHLQSTQTYTLYSSDYLTGLSYTAPNQPNPRSKLCLSCHDGTVALGAVYNNRGVAETIQMRNGVTTMPAQAAGNLGISLANDHPVGYIYDTSRDPELVARTWPWQTDMKLDPDAPTGTVECHTCHEPHLNQYSKFLRAENANAAVCTFCHAKTGWPTAIHKTSTQQYTPPGASATTVGEWACRSCHTSHGGRGVPYLLVESEEQTCYASGCHGSVNPGTGTKNIQSVMGKLYSHPTNTVSGSHRNPDNSASLNSPNRHAECQDCHNGHQVREGLHVPGSNQVSQVLQGTSGVIPAPAAAWTQPTTFTVAGSALQENQICFKCHSYYAFGLAVNGVTTIMGPSGQAITDQAMEFNPANRSAHPVQVPLNQQSGSADPRSLATGQMKPGWNLVGNQTMYCSDCHGNDQPTSASVPQGPHGSDSRFMLTGTGKFWPNNPSGRLWSLRDFTMRDWRGELLCANCHLMFDGANFQNNVHAESAHSGGAVSCITCHVAVPHGARRSRLIGYETDPAPYNFMGPGRLERLVINGFVKATGPFNYQRESCSMRQGVCHGPGQGRYEP